MKKVKMYSQLHCYLFIAMAEAFKEQANLNLKRNQSFFLRKGFSFEARSLVIPLFAVLFTFGVNKALSAQSALEKMARIDSLEAIQKFEEACILTHEFLEVYASSTTISPELLSRAFLKKGLCKRDQGQNRESIPVFAKALEQALQAGDSALISTCYRELGFSNTITGNYEHGLEAYTTALQIDTRLGADENVSVSLNAIGKIHELWRDFDTALEFFFKSLEISKNLNNLNQISVRKASIASVYKSLQNFDLALEYLEKSLALETELGNEVRRGYRLDQIGEIYTIMGDYKKAEEMLIPALQIFQENRIHVSESIVLNHLALNYMKKGDYDEAFTHYNQSLEIAERVNFSNMKLKNYEELSQLMQRKGDFSKALDYYRHFVALRDSAYNEQARRQLLDFQVKYESEQKEKELALLNQERLQDQLRLNQARQQRILMAGILTILVILLGALYSRFHIKKRAQLKLASANRQLSSLNQTKNKFFTILAHDLKNPIYAFRNISAAVYENHAELKAEDLRYYSGELKNTSEKLCSFLDELLKWAASITGRLVPKEESIELKPLFNELNDLYKPLATAKNLNLSVLVPDGQSVYADRNMVHTVFRNIISNAIKFTPEHGWVKIESSLNSHQVTISISDSGIGISEEELPKLFDIGNDPSKIGNSSEKGMGFGLFLCKEFVDKNNGKIWAESKTGNGTTIHITLPAKQVT